VKSDLFGLSKLSHSNEDINSAQSQDWHSFETPSSFLNSEPPNFFFDILCYDHLKRF
jgi:hypothetical protein